MGCLKLPIDYYSKKCYRGFFERPQKRLYGDFYTALVDQYGRFNSVTNGSDTFTYGYLTNSNLVSTLTVGDISVNNTYETNRNLITSVENKYSSTTVSKYDYINDAIGRRTSMAKSGTAFTTSDTISYGYNDRSEVTSATATNDTTYNFGFAFDNIGNRSTYTTNETGSAVTSAYTSNNLNQYTAITNPTNDPTYDNDGNMLTNGDWTYTWNGENRLIKAEKSDQKLEFTYDYMGRRVEKKVTDKVGTIWTVTKHEYFVYDGYKLIEKLNVLDSNAVTQKFVWSGETILSMTDSNGTYYYLIDANKNVGQLLDSSGTIKAKYEYSPFGKLTSSSDNVNNPFRFSSEYFDSESGLVYYNYRYYSPVCGCWLNRDPIQEYGGLNLYGMVDNDAINRIDLLGLSFGDANVLARMARSFSNFFGSLIPSTVRHYTGASRVEEDYRNATASGEDFIMMTDYKCECEISECKSWLGKTSTRKYWKEVMRKSFYNSYEGYKTTNENLVDIGADVLTDALYSDQSPDALDDKLNPPEPEFVIGEEDVGQAALNGAVSKEVAKKIKKTVISPREKWERDKKIKVAKFKRNCTKKCKALKGN